MRILKRIFDVVQVLVESEVVEAYLLVILLLLLINIEVSIFLYYLCFVFFDISRFVPCQVKLLGNVRFSEDVDATAGRLSRNYGELVCTCSLTETSSIVVGHLTLLLKVFLQLGIVISRFKERLQPYVLIFLLISFIDPVLRRRLRLYRWLLKPIDAL